jgi:hypothetical protein
MRVGMIGWCGCFPVSEINRYGMLSSVNNVGLCGGVLVAHVLLDEASLEGARGISGMGELMPKLGN